MTALEATFEPPSAVGREAEESVILNWIRNHIATPGPHCFLVEGPWGTGKTLVVKRVLRRLQEQVVVTHVDLRKTGPLAAIASIVDTIASQQPSPPRIPQRGLAAGDYSALLGRLRLSPLQLVVALDDADKCTNLDRILSWIYRLDVPTLSFVVILVSNQTGLVGRLPPDLQSRIGCPEFFPFHAYEQQELVDILTARLPSRSEPDRALVSRVAAKVAQDGGDARFALRLLRDACLSMRDGEIVSDAALCASVERQEQRQLVARLQSLAPAARLAVWLIARWERDREKKGIDSASIWRAMNAYKTAVDERRLRDILHRLELEGLVAARLLNMGRAGGRKHLYYLPGDCNLIYHTLRGTVH